MQIDHISFERIDSTNTWAKNNVERLQRAYLSLITAREQTAGRGRYTRSWVSPKDQNIYATYALFLPIRREDIGNFPQVLALAAAKTVEALGLTPTLHWPNDVMLDGKKLGGILTESVIHQGMRCLIIGIGLNVNMSGEECEAIDRPATSLKIELGQKFLVQEIQDSLTHTFHALLTKLLTDGFAPFLSDYASRIDLSKGDGCKAVGGEKEVSGQFIEITSDGSFLMQTDQGPVTIQSGEVISNF